MKLTNHRIVLKVNLGFIGVNILILKLVETMTMMISKLPIDLVEEILSRVPLISIGAVRSTCKKWNACFRDKHISKTGKEFLMNTRDHRVYLINVNHYKTHVNKFDLSVKRKGTLMSRENSGEVISIR